MLGWPEYDWGRCPLLYERCIIKGEQVTQCLTDSNVLLEKASAYES